MSFLKQETHLENPFRKELLAAEMLPERLLAILWMQLTGKSSGLLLPPQGILKQKKLYGGWGEVLSNSKNDIRGKLE